MKRKGLFSIIMILALFCIGAGVFSVVSDTRRNNAEKQNIVDLNEAKDDEDSEYEVENVAISNDKEPDLYDEKSSIPSKEGSIAEESEELTTQPVKEAAADVLMRKAASYSFGPESTLAWPVNGDIVLKYDMENTVYFKTLNEYKCNPAINISAKVGTNVGAAADGVVKSVRESEETKTTVEVEIGGGYVATYGLLDNVNLKQNDTMKKGQLIGTVAEPSSYYVKEGPNVYFKLTKDGEPIDPCEYFEEEADNE